MIFWGKKLEPYINQFLASVDSYIANRSSFLQKEVVISSGCEQQIIMFVFFPCSFGSVYYNCFIVALLTVHVLNNYLKHP